MNMNERQQRVVRRSVDGLKQTSPKEKRREGQTAPNFDAINLLWRKNLVARYDRKGVAY